MDPVGSWSAYAAAASYNRLAGTATFQAAGGAGGAGDFVGSHHHLAAAGNAGLGGHQGGGAPTPTTSQLLLQAASSTPSPFNPGGFLSPPPVGYDAMFSPLFHHASPKPAHYGSSLNRQTLAQAQAVAVANKQSAVESELTSLRENYGSAHHQAASFFEHQASQSPSPSSSLSWSHQGNAQLPSPFGILPHETVVTSSPGPVTSKTSGSPYENSFNAHFAAAHLNSQLTAVAEYKSAAASSYEKKANRAQSPLITPSTKSSSASSISPGNGGAPFFHQVPTSTSFATDSRTDCSSLSAANFSGGKSQHMPSSPDFPSSGGNSKSFNSSSSGSVHHQQQQSCIVSTASSTSASSKDYRIPQPPSRASTGAATSNLFLNASQAPAPTRVSSQSSEKQSRTQQQNFVPPTSKASPATHHNIQTKAQTKIYPELGSSSSDRRSESAALETSQSSPISFALMDATPHRQSINYAGTPNGTPAPNSSKMSGSAQRSSSQTQQPVQQQSQPQPQFQQQTQHVLAQQSGYQARHYDSTEYHHASGRNKTPTGTEPSSYPTAASVPSQPQNGPTDCGAVVPRRPSPLQAHSQASPLGHVPSPAYPMYNSPMTSMSSPSPLQQHPDGGQSSRHAPPSPLDVTVPRPASQGNQGVAYSSVITRALTTERSSSGQQDFASQKQCWAEGPDRQSQHSRKNYAVGPYGSPAGMELQQQPQQVQQQPQPPQQQRAALSISERQQAYFDSSPTHQVTLQDLSSCRGDPMSIVKNLQTLQQQACQLQQSPTAEPQKVVEEAPRVPTSKTGGNSKRRKSSEKNHVPSALNSPDAMPEYFTTRVPPPAHHNANQQAQQNGGGYFDFERWNLPPPPPKMFGAANAPHHHAHPSGPLHHVGGQPQSLMVPHPHHHPPPPLPYFPAFPLHHPTHHADFQSSPGQPSVEVGPPVPFDSPQSSTGPYPQEPPRDDQPKVIVPNIEEELGFLSDTGSAPAPVMEPKKPPTLVPSNASTGFMASYMKFLQGERDTSPPPQNRAIKKTAWVRTKTYQPEVPKTQSPGDSSATTTIASTTTATSATSVTTTTSITTLTPASSTSTSATSDKAPSTEPPPPKKVPDPPEKTYDPQDDPRYFPLPKNDASRRSFSDSDDSDTELEKERQRIQKEKEAEEAKAAQKAAAAAIKTVAAKKEASGKKADGSQKKSDGGKKEAQKKDGANKKGESTTAKKIDGSKKGEASSNKKAEGGPKKLDSASAAAQVVSKVGLTVNKNAQTAEKAKKTRTTKAAKKKLEQEEVDPLAIPPRREMSRRKAKEKTTIKQFLDRQESLDEDFDLEEPDLMDSDSDPAWTPATKDSSDEDGGGRRRSSRRSRIMPSRSKKPRLLSDGQDGEEAPSPTAGESSPEQKTQPPQQNKQQKQQPAAGRRQNANHRTAKGRTRSRTASTASTTPPASQPAEDAEENDLDILPFKAGEFVVMKSDLGDEYPPIWRIDGKTLLQKYEPFDHDGETLYRNISTYSGWSPQNRTIYQQVPVKYRIQNRLETIVEFLKNEMSLDDQELIDKSMNETAKYQDNFEVYIQTLISQALDSNFLMEIFQEKDDYFLSNVKMVDDVTEERKRRLLQLAQWRPDSGLQESVATWPCFNVLSELPADERGGRLACVACARSPGAVRVQAYGQPYNATTLEGCQPDPRVASQKDFLVCNECASRVKLYNKVAHQKYLMYIECAKRVAEKRSLDPKKDTTVILNELLADEAWLNQLFKCVRTSWAEIDKLGQVSSKSDEAAST
ncbi:mucin-5AC [Bacillus rossius redtenbacheri]|uniref:mucin-5AC n=1 Tax=Bacillus rossius redtenbacheri TaxID=93214 RepID=UPI002FDDA28F